MPHIDENIGVYILYPEKRYVPGRQILQWLADAIDNGVVPPQDRTDNILDAAMLLDDVGYITVQRTY